MISCYKCVQKNCCLVVLYWNSRDYFQTDDTTGPAVPPGMNMRNTTRCFRSFSPNTVNFNYHHLHQQYNCFKCLGLHYLALCEISWYNDIKIYIYTSFEIYFLLAEMASMWHKYCWIISFTCSQQTNRSEANKFSTQNKSRKLFLAIFSWRGIWRVSNLSEQNNFHKEAKFVAIYRPEHI